MTRRCHNGSTFRIDTFALVVLIALAVSPRPAAAQAADEVTYYHADAIGSVRMITGPNQEVLARYDYLPFGEPWPSGEEPPPLPNTRRFAGKELDGETGFEYFGARYYASLTGRFTTVDPGHVGGDIFNPQSWNAYAYALNNPFRFIDPLGTCSQDANGNYVDRDDAGTLVTPGPCPRGNDGALTTGITATVSVKPKPAIVALAEGISVGAGPVADSRFIAGFYVASAAGGLALWGGGAFAGAELTTLSLAGEVASTPLIRGAIIEGFKVGNHVARKAGLGRGATTEIVQGTIRGARAAGTITSEVGTGRFAGNAIQIFVHNGVKVVVDTTSKTIMSVQKLGGFYF